MVGKEHLEDSFNSLSKALVKLKDAIEAPVDSQRFIIDATIQRFEFTIELFWKVLKKFVENEGEQAKSPREVLKKAYAFGWINNEKTWLDMLIDRNLTSHTYNENKADEIFYHIKEYYPKMKSLHDLLKTKLMQIHRTS